MAGYPQELISLVVLVSGVGIAVFEGSGTQVTLHGILLCIAGTVSNGFMMASIGKLLSEKLDVWRLTFYTAPVAALMLLPFYWRLEAGRFQGGSIIPNIIVYVCRATVQKDGSAVGWL